MGYSVSVKFKTSADREKMKSFLEDNQELLSTLEKTEFYRAFSTQPVEGEELGYSPKTKNLLGFYGSGIPHYGWDLCAWMAVKAQPQLDKKFFYYDNEKMFLTSDPYNQKDTVVDSEGLRVDRIETPEMAESSSLFKKAIDSKTQKEVFIQLNDKWNILQNKPKRNNL